MQWTKVTSLSSQLLVQCLPFEHELWLLSFWDTRCFERVKNRTSAIGQSSGGLKSCPLICSTRCPISEDSEEQEAAGLERFLTLTS